MPRRGTPSRQRNPHPRPSLQTSSAWVCASALSPQPLALTPLTPFAISHQLCALVRVAAATIQLAERVLAECLPSPSSSGRSATSCVVMPDTLAHISGLSLSGRFWPPGLCDNHCRVRSLYDPHPILTRRRARDPPPSLVVERNLIILATLTPSRHTSALSAVWALSAQ